MFYAFVCRAALGPSPFVTKDGKKDVKGELLFRDRTKSSLKGGKHALVAEAGGDGYEVHRFVDTSHGLSDESLSHACRCATRAGAHDRPLTRDF